MNSPQFETDLTLAARYLVPFILLLIIVWRSKVNTVVPEPYLDEVFHIRQAQTYWAHNWTHWDPKITTPPGLYLWSYLLCRGLLLLRGSPEEVGPNELRATNVVATALLLPWRLQTLLDLLRKERNTRPSGAWVSNTVLNICLFPPLFFFSALYYTDILALLVVVEAYIWDIKRSSNGPTRKTWSSALIGHASIQTVGFLAFGLAALVFRQTNIFWVAVFMGGLQVVRTIRQNTTPCKSSDLLEILKQSSHQKLYDPLVEEASLPDYFKASLSLVAAAIINLALVVVSILPHIIILGAFGAFVLWNGSVVLGHKEFHAAGIHIPQMLYIWPYFVFFSWPLLLVSILNLVVPSRYLPKFFDYRFKNNKRLPGMMSALRVIPLMLAAIHFNTIVHPFTLADNRHYVFYVFRIILRYHPAVKYAAALIYFFCAWGVLTVFGFSTPPFEAQTAVVPTSVIDSVTAQQAAANQKSKIEKETKKKNKPSSQKASSKAAIATQEKHVLTPEIVAKIQAHILQRQQKQEQQQIRVSFVIIWLASTTLSLITAPLVEPRYFIIPWVMWRLHLPRQPTSEAYRRQRQRPRSDTELTKAQVATYLPQILETAWFIAINAITGYLFLYKGFEWPQEPGQVQRFMW